MNKEERENLLFLLILSKKLELLRDGTNVSFNDLLDYLNDFYFKGEKPTKTKLLKFMTTVDKKEIVDYL
jgi:ribosome maturation protein Sdo1